MSDGTAFYADIFTHSFDEKGRITVPSEWREPHFEQNLIVVPSGDSFLQVFPASFMARMLDKLKQKETSEDQRAQIQNLAASSHAAKLDAQGRIVIKEHLRKRAGLPLKAKASVVFVGAADHFQIYEKSEWDKRAPAPTDYKETVKKVGP